jgi:RNA polymerase sigma factor (sigma-70 family)
MPEAKLFFEEYPTISRLHRQLNVHATAASLVDEKILLEECRKQNRNAQKMLYETHFKKMMPVCLRYLKSEDDAREVLNDAFLKVFSKIHQYKSEGSLGAWIKRIVINCSIDFVRSSKSYRANFIHTNEFHMYGAPVSEEDEELAQPGYDFSCEEIFEMVAALPQATRIVFNLYVVDRFTHRQIAQSLKISEGTSKWHLSNARKILKEKIIKTAAVKNAKSKHGESPE